MSFFLERLVQLRVGTAFLVIWQRLDYETGEPQEMRQLLKKCDIIGLPGKLRFLRVRGREERFR